MNLCNVCKKYFNEPHDCTTTREEKLPRVWIREEPWHEEALKNLEVVATDIASNYARRGSHWIEYIRIETHESILRYARAKALVRSDGLLLALRKIAWKICDHAGNSGGELCECSTDMMLVAEKAIKQFLETKEEQATEARKE